MVAELYNTDCVPFMAGMADESVDLILTDIPYGVVNDAAGDANSQNIRNLNKGGGRCCKLRFTRGGGTFLSYFKGQYLCVLFDRASKSFEACVHSERSFHEVTDMGENESFADGRAVHVAFEHRVLRLWAEKWCGIQRPLRERGLALSVRKQQGTSDRKELGFVQASCMDFERCGTDGVRPVHGKWHIGGCGPLLR